MQSSVSFLRLSCIRFSAPEIDLDDSTLSFVRVSPAVGTSEGTNFSLGASGASACGSGAGAPSGDGQTDEDGRAAPEDVEPDGTSAACRSDNLQPSSYVWGRCLPLQAGQVTWVEPRVFHVCSSFVVINEFFAPFDLLIGAV